MSGIPPFERWYGDPRWDTPVALAPELAAIYGDLLFPSQARRPYVIANFVSTLDGVVTLGVPGHAGGSDISGKNSQDRLLMGILRSVADVVIVAAGTLRAEPRHVWTPANVAPAYAAAFAQTRTQLGKAPAPLTVLVTSRGQLDLQLPVFQSGQTDVWIVTPSSTAARLRAQPLPAHVEVIDLTGEKTLSVRALLDLVQERRPADMILTEGGPQLMSGFLAEHCLDELFLTLAPQVAGRDDPRRRPGFVSGQEFGPGQPLWSTLVDVRRGASHLFLRYSF